MRPVSVSTRPDSAWLCMARRRWAKRMVSQVPIQRGPMQITSSSVVTACRSG